jgi:addiction module HigA family antidote
MTRLSNIHPGEVLLEEFLIPMSLSQNRIARNISVPPRRINEIVHGKRAITADTALRLARYFGISEEFWMGLQADYDLEEARHKLGNRLVDEVGTHAAWAFKQYPEWFFLKLDPNPFMSPFIKFT